MTLIQIPDEPAAMLQAKAAERGLTLEAWLIALAVESMDTPVAVQPRRNIAEIIRENMQDVPPEVMASMPTDGAAQHDHYIYGWPKRES